MESIPNISSISIHSLDTSNIHKKYIAQTGERYFEISESVALLIQLLQTNTEKQEIIASISSRTGRTYTEDDLQSIIKRCIYPILQEDKEKKKTFLFRKELISPKSIEKTTAKLQHLFKQKIALLFFSIILILEACFFISTTGRVRLEEVNFATVSGILLFFIFSSLIHELGHASACSYYKVRHGGIGFGVYMNFPVFYTDVSNIWRLNRKQRMIVNIAGVYFQLILLLVLISFYFITHDSIVKYIIYTININFLITLNPFFKFDGYWIMSDLLGVPNLRARTTELVSYGYNKLRRKTTLKKPFILTMKPAMQVFMILYSLVVNLFFAYYFCFILPRFMYGFCSDFPQLAWDAILTFASGGVPEWNYLRTIFSQLLFFGFTVFFIYRLLKSLIAKINKSKQTA